jgi:hypothetical protein
MQPEQAPRHSHLFTVRLWLEPLGDGQAEWRGKVQHASSGEARYFRGWPALQAFLENRLQSPDEGEAD